MGLMAAENLLEDKRHDLWAINTDYENYQESSIITETGLEERHAEYPDVIPLRGWGAVRPAEQESRSDHADAA
jgi:hypothetical protein